MGAFIEAAASMGHTTWLLMRNPEKAKKVRAECRSSFSREELESGKLTLDDVYTKLTFTECAIKSSEGDAANCWRASRESGDTDSSGIHFPRDTSSPRIRESHS